MESKEKVIALYKYIKELCALKYRVVTDVNEQIWTRYLKDIPDDPENIAIFYRDRVEEEADDNTVLLTVKKPNFQRCQEPPDILKAWLKPGWDRYANEVKVKKTSSDNVSSNSATQCNGYKPLKNGLLKEPFGPKSSVLLTGYGVSLPSCLNYIPIWNVIRKR